MKARLSRAQAPAACGHRVDAGQVIVRTGRRWTCGPCSLPGGTTAVPPRCPACGQPAMNEQMGLSPVRGWVHLLCVTDADRAEWARQAAALIAREGASRAGRPSEDRPRAYVTSGGRHGS